MHNPNPLPPNWEAIKEIWNRIRPYYDSEVSEVISSQLLADEEFLQMAKTLFPPLGERLLQHLPNVNSIEQFKDEIMHDIVRLVAKQTSFSCELSGKSNIKKISAGIFISNHRDIVLDSSLLNVLLKEEGFSFLRIAMGDNLLLKSWIEKVVKLSDSVIVERSLSPRAFLESSNTLSTFFNYSIQHDKRSVWIAQREGRSKDNNDTTQPALLKMLTMSGSGPILQRIKELNIIPTTISYEFDPCDYLKAKELAKRAENGEYKKTPMEDLFSMQQGIMGYKGRIHFHLGTPLNEMIYKNEQNGVNYDNLNKAQLYIEMAGLIDREIYCNYRFYPCNYVAEDMLCNSKHNFNKGLYSEKDREDFTIYIEQRLHMSKPENEKQKDSIFNILLQQYSNPLKNYRSTKKM